MIVIVIVATKVHPRASTSMKASASWRMRRIHADAPLLASFMRGPRSYYIEATAAVAAARRADILSRDHHEGIDGNGWWRGGKPGGNDAAGQLHPLQHCLHQVGRATGRLAVL